MSKEPEKTTAPTAVREQTARGVVARGRTIAVPDPRQQRVVGFGEDGRPIQQSVVKQFGPGQEIELPCNEITQLRKSGFLVDPDAKPMKVDTGANVSERITGGPSFASVLAA